MRDDEEHALIKIIEDAGHPEVAKHVYEVLSKRDRFHKEIFDRFDRLEDKQASACERLELLDKIFQEHMKEELDRIEEYMREVRTAFPGGDFTSHRRTHELFIRKEEQRVQLRQAIIDKSLSALLWGAILFIGIASWNYIKELVKVGS